MVVFCREICILIARRMVITSSSKKMRQSLNGRVQRLVITTIFAPVMDGRGASTRVEEPLSHIRG